MATVGLSWLKEAAQTAAQAAADAVTVTVTMSGGDNWNTGDGSVSRSFDITLEG